MKRKDKCDDIAEHEPAFFETRLEADKKAAEVSMSYRCPCESRIHENGKFFVVLKPDASIDGDGGCDEPRYDGCFQTREAAYGEYKKLLLGKGLHPIGYIQDKKTGCWVLVYCTSR